VKATGGVAQLFAGYRGEGLTMPYPMEDFTRDYVKEHLHKLTLEERFEGMSAEQIESVLKKLKAKQKTPRRSKRPLLRRLASSVTMAVFSATRRPHPCSATQPAAPNPSHSGVT
jgi:hypothetical protein